jgi:hypothetical protein
MFVISNAMKRWTVQGGNVEGPWLGVDVEDSSLNFVCSVGWSFIVAQSSTNDDRAIRMVAVVDYVVWGFEDRFGGKVGFRDKHYVGIGIVEKLDDFRFMVQKSICVPRGDSKGVNGQNGMGYL